MNFLCNIFVINQMFCLTDTLASVCSFLTQHVLYHSISFVNYWSCLWILYRVVTPFLLRCYVCLMKALGIQLNIKWNLLSLIIYLYVIAQQSPLSERYIVLHPSLLTAHILWGVTKHTSLKSCHLLFLCNQLNPWTNMTIDQI